MYRLAAATGLKSEQTIQKLSPWRIQPVVCRWDTQAHQRSTKVRWNQDWSQGQCFETNPCQVASDSCWEDLPKSGSH